MYGWASAGCLVMKNSSAQKPLFIPRMKPGATGNENEFIAAVRRNCSSMRGDVEPGKIKIINVVSLSTQVCLCAGY